MSHYSNKRENDFLDFGKVSMKKMLVPNLRSDELVRGSRGRSVILMYGSHSCFFVIRFYIAGVGKTERLG